MRRDSSRGSILLRWLSLCLWLALLMIGCQCVNKDALDHQRIGVWTTASAPESNNRSVVAAAADATKFEQAKELMRLAQYKPAIDAFSDVLPRLMKTNDFDRAAETLFWLGFCHEKSGDAPAAQLFYRRTLAEYPAAPAANQAAQRLARLMTTE